MGLGELVLCALASALWLLPEVAYIFLALLSPLVPGRCDHPCDLDKIVNKF